MSWKSHPCIIWFLSPVSIAIMWDDKVMSCSFSYKLSILYMPVLVMWGECSHHFRISVQYCNNSCSHHFNYVLQWWLKKLCTRSFRPGLGLQIVLVYTQIIHKCIARDILSVIDWGKEQNKVNCPKGFFFFFCQSIFNVSTTTYHQFNSFQYT